METSQETKDILIATSPASKGALARRFAKSRAFRGRSASTQWRSILTRTSLPGVTIVDMGSVKSKASLKVILGELAAKQEATAEATFIVLVFSSPKRPEPAEVTEFLRPFSKPERVEITWGANEEKVGAIVESIEPKLALLREAEAAKSSSPRPSPLDRIEKVLMATRDLRSEKGNLSARLIADLYGVSLSEIGQWTGRSRQSINKAPDAESLQDTLAFFERIARLRLRLSDVDFRKWLRIPNALLDGKRPLDLLAQGGWQVLADFVDDLLTGSPT
jgi:hypothetical protein